MSMASGNMRRGNRGFSLIELMVAMTVSLILLIGVGQIYLGTSATGRAQEGLSRVQENARFGIDALARQIRMAGHSGCARSSEVETTVMANHADEGYILGGRHVEGVADATSAPSDFWLNEEPDNLFEDENGNGEPAIRITFASGSDMAAVPGTFGTSAEFDVDSNTVGLRQNDFIVITDCQTAHVAEITNNIDDSQTKVNIAHGQGGGSTGGGNDPHQWKDHDQDYDSGAQAMRYFSYTFYIGENARGNPALYRREDMRSDGQAEVVELVDNVEAMRLAYGTDTDGDLKADQYELAQNLSGTDWDTVVSVRASLLLRSDEVLSEPRTMSFNPLGQGTLTFNDSRRIRQVATRTITMRNRMP